MTSSPAYLFVIVILVVVVAFLTLSVSVTNVSPGNPLPHTTNYGVTFPEGQTISIANTHINVLSYQNELISDIDATGRNLWWERTGLYQNGVQ